MNHPVHNGGALATISRTHRNTFYGKAIAAQPGYLEAVALRDKAMAMKRGVVFPLVAYPDPPTTTSTDLDDYLTAYTAAWDEEQSRVRRAEALDTVIGASERTMRSATDDPDRLLAHLAADLDELMAEVTQVVARLNGATTPAEAITADTVAAWRQLPPLRKTYDAIRQAQELVLIDAPEMNSRSIHVDDPLASDTQFANLDEIFPGWRDRDARFALQGTPPDRRPWPNDPISQLVWMVTGGAEVWIPTSSQLAELHRQRRHRIDPPADGEPGNLMSDYGPHKSGLTKPRPAPVIR